MTPTDSSESVERLVRPDLRSLGAYSPHKAPETLKISPDKIIKLDANENPYGCSPRVLRALADFNKWHTYPDAGQTNLRRQLGEYAGVDPESIVAANGSGELLDQVMALLLEPGDEVMNCPPTFDLYRVRALINRGKLVTIPRHEDFSVDIKAVRAAVTSKTKLIVLANPNSPTGNLTPESDIIDLLETGAPVLIDEAYYEFYGQTIASLVSKYRNLMVLRTCSKWAALAGLRIGYGIFPPEIAGYLMRIKLPYNVNLAAQIAVQETVKDVAHLKQGVKSILAERKRLYSELEKLKCLKPFPSQANFVLCSMLKGKAADIQQQLQERGILVRYFDQPLVANCIRISVGKPEHTDTLIKALKEIEKGL